MSEITQLQTKNYVKENLLALLIGIIVLTIIMTIGFIITKQEAKNYGILYGVSVGLLLIIGIIYYKTPKFVNY